jgi:hypothetical protein
VSYNLTLQCGCLVYVACDPQTHLAHTRILEKKSPAACTARRHDVGLRLYLWELLPDPIYRPRPEFVSDGSRLVRL